MRKLALGLAAVATTAIAIPATAQSINQREHRQEQRIRRGERTGQLTPAEARRLQFLQIRLRRTEARMRMRNGGRLSPRQRIRLREIERRDNAEIYRLKHNYRRY